jgi:gluconokinase
MSFVPGLRSNYAQVGPLVYFGRCLDKIRLRAADKLPAEYHDNLGAGFDARLCTFLGVSYADLKTHTLTGATDADILAWARARGTPRSDEDCAMWSRFMTKIGWRDERSAALKQRIAVLGLEAKPIETFFDLNEFDEGRDPVAGRFWENPPSA